MGNIWGGDNGTYWVLPTSDRLVALNDPILDCLRVWVIDCMRDIRRLWGNLPRGKSRALLARPTRVWCVFSSMGSNGLRRLFCGGCMYICLSLLLGCLLSMHQKDSPTARPPSPWWVRRPCHGCSCCCCFNRWSYLSPSPSPASPA
jgi:hypothetical protein